MKNYAINFSNVYSARMKVLMFLTGEVLSYNNSVTFLFKISDNENFKLVTLDLFSWFIKIPTKIKSNIYVISSNLIHLLTTN